MELTDNIDAIQLEKTNKIIPENIKSGVTIFGVTGELDGTSGTVPVGAIFPYGSLTPPAGYLVCDGSEISRTTYEDLYKVIGTTFGTGNRNYNI